MDVDDDDEYTNAADAHAAFVMTVSAANMYWCHAQHAHDINIHKLPPLPEKMGLGRSAEFLHSGTGYIENSRVRCMIDFLPISVRIFQDEHWSFWKIQWRFQWRKSAQWNRLHWKSRVCSMPIWITISITIFCVVEHGLPISITISNTISITKIGIVEPVTLKLAVFIPCRFQSRIQSRFQTRFQWRFSV